MSELKITVDGVATAIAADQRPTQLFAERKDVVVCRINGELRDLWTDLVDGDVIESVTIDSEEGLKVLRHSTAHVMAQAVQQIYPEAKLGIGPPITDGFYYDFDPEESFTPESLEKIESAMRKIIKDGQRFKRRVTSEADALVELAKEPYKCELIGLKGGSSDESSVEVGGAELTIYDNLGRDGQPVWSDLCRGPHLPSTKHIPAFKLMRSAGAYWRGSEKNPMLQRIYGTAWPSVDALNAYLELLLEAEKRDHRRLGAELDLFSFPEEIGSGLAVFHPKGGAMRKVMEDYSRERHEQSGYEFVYSPHITKSNLFEASGHLQWYSDGMFPPMRLDEEIDADGVVRKHGQDYYLKPMNCPFHILIFKSQSRSYRDLPMRLFEFGSVYRYEKSGTLHGLTRVRGMTQDDAHLFVTPENMELELTNVLNFVLGLLRDYGLDDFYLELSTKEDGNPKFVGEDGIWKTATEALEKVALKSGLELLPDPGGAAFYGPKISVQARDAIGRTWQMSTIQLDFNLPERFDLEYAAADGTRQRPIMIHRALFGSIERFFGVLTEHYAGHFPPWLAPVQVVGIPVANEFGDYLDEIAQTLRAQGVRVEVDHSDDRMQKKILNHAKAKVPFMLIAGGQDRDSGAVSFRFRDGTQENGIAVGDAVARILEAISNKSQV